MDELKARSFVFYESYLDSIESLDDPALKLNVCLLILNYGIKGIIKSDVDPISKSIFYAHKVNIDRSLKRRDASIENGKLGGAPLGNQNARKQENNLEQPRNNLNENVDVNMNVNENANADKNDNSNANADRNANEDGIIKGRGIRSKKTSELQKYFPDIDPQQLDRYYQELKSHRYISRITGQVIETVEDMENDIERIKEVEET